MTGKKRLTISVILLVIFSFVFFPGVSGAEKKDWTDCSDKILQRDRAIAAAMAVGLKQYPDADVVVVDQKNFVRYRKDGTYVEMYEVWQKVLTEKGKRRLKTVSSMFTKPYNTTRFDLVEVIDAKGNARPVDIRKNCCVMTDANQMRENIYNPNSRILRVNIPRLEIGETLHFIMTDVFEKVRVPGTYSNYVLFESTDPINRSVFMVEGPKELPLRSIVLKDEIPGTVTFDKTEKENRIIYTWKAKNVPRAFPEPQMPPFHRVAQRLLVSTIDDWRSISSWYWDLCRPAIEDTSPQMTEMVNRLTKGIDSFEKKIESIFFWVSQKIRYLGITVEKEAPGYEPHPVSMTFNRRAGVCRDKAALLVSMLRLAGFEAYPVLIMNGPKKDPEVPQPYFNHAIACVVGPDGSISLMDPTDENTKQLFPAYLNNQSYLIAKPDGDILRTSPVEKPENNMMEVRTTGRIKENGKIESQTHFTFNGINDNAYRNYFSRLTPEELKSFFEGLIRKTFAGSRVKQFEIIPKNILDMSKTLEARIEYEADDLRIQGNDAAILPVPLIGENVGMVRFLLGNMGLKKRKYPIVTKYACGVHEVMKMDLGKALGKPLSIPKYENVETEGVSWSREVICKNGVLEAQNRFQLNLPEYSPENYMELKKTLQIVERNEKKMPVFRLVEKKQDSGKRAWGEDLNCDAVILDEDVDIDVKNASSWIETRRTRIKILTYAGKKRFSDLKIDYNPIWEKVHVESVSVTMEDGNEKIIDPREINEMDMAWVGDAPRYPKGKTIVISFPGVEKNSVIDFKIVREKWNRPYFSLGSTFFLTSLSPDRSEQSLFSSITGCFRYREPILKKTLRLKFPKNIPIEVSWIPETLFRKEGKGKEGNRFHISKKIQGNDIIFKFSGERILPEEKEGYQPPWWAFNPMVFASDNTPKIFEKTLFSELKRAATKRKEVRKKVRELLKGITDEKQKILAVRNFVASRIKQIDLSVHDLPLELISTADKTLLDGYGSNADLAVLLFAMLEEAGFQPQYLLVSDIPFIRNMKAVNQKAGIAIFNLLVVRIPDKTGFLYLNDTNQYAEPGTSGHYGFSGIVLPSGKMEVIRASNPIHEDAIKTFYCIRLKDNGEAEVDVRNEYFGMDYAAFKQKFAEMSPEEKRRSFLEKISDMNRSAEALKEPDIDYSSYPGTETYSVKIPYFAASQDGYMFMEIPQLISGLKGVRKDNRKTPLFRDWSSSTTLDISINLPEVVESILIMPPEKKSFNIAGFGDIDIMTIKKDSKRKGLPKTIHLRQDIHIHPMLVSPDDYPKLLNVQKEIGHPVFRKFLLKLKKPE